MLTWLSRFAAPESTVGCAVDGKPDRPTLQSEKIVMKKKPILRLPKPIDTPNRSWHNGGDIEIGLYARSLHRAAQTLIKSLELEPNPKTAWDACPILLLYRQAIELHLKFLVGEGGNFLPTPTDSITLYKTHSLRWLAQIVCQIIKSVKWEKEFRCEGISTLAEFSAAVAELEALDPVVLAVHSGNRTADGWVPPQLQPPNVVRFAKKLDVLIDLLDSTADGLAAASDLRRMTDGDSSEPIVQ